ncbi:MULTISPECIES: hypothetical protein [Aestuariibaculum]|uniref:DUF4258 domain-containing protein n=1 Tax=Aestuariibaculum lutulentum TaxID=2920935 RepID=A0ABS9RLJ0_9FLAO|nr:MULTISPECIES: hypothetical protein [Aestuariibaculum]MCH4553823.1 hypothetical protein [Aestuariibaculum lutulentum]MCR8667626.1 hypothetical protein [Aestuariibaculum sp. M13]
MKLIQRIGYYLGGFSFGLIILAFFLNGKKVSCSYGPDARVLKNIREKQIVYPSELSDTIMVNYILKKGDVNFSESDVHKKPCGVYVVEGEYEEKNILLTIENCDSIATISNIAYK